MFRFKGIRIRQFHRNIILWYCLLMELPFLVSGIAFILWEHARSPTDFLSIKNIVLPLIIIFLGLIIVVCVYKHSEIKNGFFSRVKHRQLLARMIVDNKLYLTKTKVNNQKREKIIYFPKVYYQYKNHVITVRFPMDLQKNQDKFNHIGEQLEQALYGDLFEIRDEKGYKAYRLNTNTISKRIQIKDIHADNGKIELMNGYVWDYNKFPHALIAGVTGGGKTYFLQALLKAFLDLGADCYVCDPKMSDLSQLDQAPILKGKVFATSGQIGKCIREFYEAMVERQKEYQKKLMESGEIGKDYRSFDMQPKVLFIDEYVAYLSNLEYKEQTKVLGQLKQIILLGRQLGFFLIAGMQRPDAKYFEDGMRDQFGLRVTLGQMSSSGYTMMFGENEKDYKVQPDNIRGWGYASIGGADVRSFFAPFVSQDFSFLSYLKSLPASAEKRGAEGDSGAGSGTDQRTAEAGEVR